MKTIYPQKLKKEDEIRVVAFSQSLADSKKSILKLAEKRLNDMGFKVTYGKNVFERDMFESSSIQSRVDDFHTALKDRKVKTIISARGGFNVNQLLPYIDYELIKYYPKIITGYSDITALLWAIYAKTGLVTYHGPVFTSFAELKGFEYTEDYWVRCLTQKKSYIIVASKYWSQDKWKDEQEKRNFIKNDGYKIIQTGKAEGIILGGNLCTISLLQGTEYMPGLKNVILFLEDDNIVGKFFPLEFERNLQSLLQQKSINIKGVVFGRFQKKSMRQKELDFITKTKLGLKNIPIISGADFGHTTPQFSFPIGGKVKLTVSKVVNLAILRH